MFIRNLYYTVSIDFGLGCIFGELLKRNILFMGDDSIVQLTL